MNDLINLTPVLQAVISLCVAVVTAVIVPWIRRKAGRERAELLFRLAGIAVNAAEQIYPHGENEQKLDYVISYLRQHGFDVNKEELLPTIEAAVRRYMHSS